MKNSNWCEHCELTAYGRVNTKGIKGVSGSTNSWQYCPICGAKRPEKEKLGQILSKKSNEFIARSFWDDAANVAIDEVLRIINKHKFLIKFGASFTGQQQEYVEVEILEKEIEEMR